MKIVSGKFGGRKLLSPQNKDVRPTSDKIRGAIFNMLQSRGAIEGANVLDGFCGTGALGLESLSRGAVRCIFMDNARTSLELAQENARIFGAEEDCVFSLKDATKISERKGEQEAYTLVFLDPPYAKSLVKMPLEALVGGKWLADNCLVVCESERRCSINIMVGFNVDSEKTYGDTKVTLLTYSAN